MFNRILIVDDSKAMRNMVRRTPRHAGFGACDVAEANGAQFLITKPFTAEDVRRALTPVLREVGA